MSEWFFFCIGKWKTWKKKEEKERRIKNLCNRCGAFKSNPVYFFRFEWKEKFFLLVHKNLGGDFKKLWWSCTFENSCGRFLVRMKDRWKGWSCFLTCWLLVSGIVECGGSDVADADVDADVADFNTTTTTTSARTTNLSDMTTSHAATSLASTASTASTARKTTNEGKQDLTVVI